MSAFFEEPSLQERYDRVKRTMGFSRSASYV